MSEDTSEKPSVTTSGQPDFEVPKGPVTPEHQAFLVNANLLREEFQTKLANLPETEGSQLEDIARRVVKRNLLRLDHAYRYMNGQPYDKSAAQVGLHDVMGRAIDRASDVATRKDPDDAAAAASEIPLLNNVLEKFKSDNKT